ncbi:MAG TPA: aspartate--ammonia ligase [bacterium]|nr:aspartate--ammonia ligase [bacterium]
MQYPPRYHSPLFLIDTEEGIVLVKEQFQKNLSEALHLRRVSAPLVVLGRTGINDYLDGTGEPVGFPIPFMNGERGEVVQSLAKWKRNALGEYGFKPGEGLYTDMNALRPNEALDNLHSIYVDQWDWERIMHRDERNLDFLKTIVRRIYEALKLTEAAICMHFPRIEAPFLPDKITFIHAEELEEMYPGLTPKEREDAVCREKGAVFIIGIGAALRSGTPHDSRAADYDDWITETINGYRGLNGDILVWYPILERAVELSSMGIRVNKESLYKQLEIRNELHKAGQPFHQRVLKDALPQTIGGGIGQSRLCMIFLRKAHIGEVQSAIWPEEMVAACKKHRIQLL